MSTSNYQKHTHRNPIQRFLVSNFYKKTYETLKPLKPNKVLDVGCGEGITIKKLKEEKIGKTYEGVDPLPEALKLAKRVDPETKYTKASIYDLPYKDNSFDLVLCMEVLEHLDKPDKALSELKRVSSKYVYITVPHEPWFLLSQLFRGRHIARFGNHPEHINHWTPWTINSLVKSKGLEVKSQKLPFAWIQILTEKSKK